MKRRDFLSKTSAGFSAFLIAPYIWNVDTKQFRKKSYDFQAYRKGKTFVPVIKITPGDGYYIHTFYDTCPWSPDGKSLVVTKLPYQGKKPQWGDSAEICLIDLDNQTIETIYETKAWSYQVGANAQWSETSSRYLYTNDIIDGNAVCVKIDLKTRKSVAYMGPKYDISADGNLAAGPELKYINITQYGYGIPDPAAGKPLQLNKNQMDSEGLWLTNLQDNHKQLLASLNDFYKCAIPEDQQFYKNGVYYLFHTKFNKQGSKIMQVFRCLFNGEGRNASLFTLNTDGENIIQCLPREKWNQKARLGGSGNHPNWHPDGEHIIMNTVPTWLGYQDMMFSMFKFDGSDFRILSEKHLGSGHPSVDPTTRYLITDAYIKQTYVVKDDEIPIRFIELKEDREFTLCTVSNNVGNQGKMYSDQGGSQFKLDPHPVWSRNYKAVCFNGAVNGQRQVFIADLKGIL